MDNAPHLRLALSDRSYINIVKKEIHKIAEQISFTPQRLAEVDIIIAEIATNLIKHSIDGEVLVKHFNKDNEEGIEIISIDKGPGMQDPNSMLKDGVSTKKTLGQGLGAIKRLSDDFDIYSLVGWGTVLLSRVYKNISTPRKKIAFRTVMVAKKNEIYCGDGYQYIGSNEKYNILALDGLGHGEEAHKAVKEAIKFHKSYYGNSPAEMIKLMHKAIKSTRGAVGMALQIDLRNKSLFFCGVGNIAAKLIEFSRTRSLISYNGIIGHILPVSMKDNILLWDSTSCLIISSDGLKNKWDLDKFPNLSRHDGSIIAATLFKDQIRETDDTLVMVITNQKQK